MRSPIACSVVAAVIGAAAPAGAEPTTAERAVAETLFKDAKKLMARGKVPEACEKFASSYQIDPAGGTLLNLAMCHEVEGKTATAWTEFNEALSVAKKSARADRQKAANEHITALEARLSRVTLTVPASAPPGLALKIDGIAVAPAAIGTAIPVDPGDHVAAATAPGKKAWETKFSLKEGQKQELSVPTLEDAAPPPSAPPPSPPSRWLKPTGIAALGAGAVLLGVGTAFGVHAVSLGSQVTEQCPQRTCSPGGWKALGDGRSAANVANGTLIAGGVVAAAGTALLIAGVVTSPAEAPRTGRLPFAVAPVVGPGSAFLTAGGVF